MRVPIVIAQDLLPHDAEVPRTRWPCRSVRHRRANQRRAVRLLLWAGGLFALAHLAGGLLLDYLWPQVRFPGAARRFDLLQRFPRTPDIISLGSSRMEGD